MKGSPLSRRSVLKFVGLFSLCLALAVSCGSPQASQPDAAGDSTDRITIGTTLKAETLDPADAYSIFPGILLYNLGDRLYTYATGTTDLVPQLATELPTISEDGLTYTIPLREGVTFHDGTPFNAEAMKFSLDRFIQNGGGPSFLLDGRVESVTATGEHELTITLTEPFAAFTSVLTFSGLTPVSPQAYEIGEGQFKPDTFVGTGPYKLAQFTPDVIRLDPYENYWGDKPVNSGVDLQVFASAANLFNTFQTGGIDISYQTLDPDQIKSLVDGAATGGWQVIEAGGNVINYLVLNQKSEPLNDVKVRQAIAALIDRNLLSERVFQGQADPLYSLLPTTFPIYQPVFQEEYGDGDVDKAKQLLAEAGITESNPLTLEIWYSSSSQTRGLVANTLKAGIERAVPGLVTVEPNSVESATLFGNLDKGTYPSVLLDWYADYYDADSYIEPFLSCSKGSDTTLCEEGQSQAGGSFYYSEPANELINQQRAEKEATAREGLLKELQTLAATDVPYIPLWQSKEFVFAQAGVENVQIQPAQQYLVFAPIRNGQ